METVISNPLSHAFLRLQARFQFCQPHGIAAFQEDEPMLGQLVGERCFHLFDVGELAEGAVGMAKFLTHEPHILQFQRGK